ncbi:glycosyltransferase family 39 protein [Chloroflexus sp.]|uniref:glycosyltransferase family 39 protein n=1 Tax=Chloroflexus sp. TaxID=1904827 RepID=UPI002FD9438B
MGHIEQGATESTGAQTHTGRRPMVEWVTWARAEWQTVRWLALLVLIHSLVYVFLVPPWQHYDEPGHFLYAAYIARGGIDAPDNVMVAREVADSMYRHGFWPPDVRPDLLSPRPPGIPTDQRLHPPLYYALMAGPLSLLRYLSVETQLYAVRLISAGLMVLTVLAVWRLIRVVLPTEPELAVIVAGLVALTPAFADLMSAFNSDVLMNMAAAAAFLGFALALRDGWRPTGLTLALVATLVALMTKRTAAPLVIPLLVALVWGAWRSRIRWWVYLAGAVIALGGLAVSGFEWTAEGARSRPWLATLEQNYFRAEIVPWLQSWLNWERAWPLYLSTIGVAHNHFWARLAWGHIPILPPVGDWLFAGLSVAALVGLARGWFDWRHTWPLWLQRWFWLCLVAVIAAWIALLGRLHPLPEGVSPYIPRGRYLYWAMVPTMWLLVMGWRHLWPERWRSHARYALIAIFGVVDLAAIVTLAMYYYQ